MLPNIEHNLCFCCREQRGFGFVQYVDPADAAEAKYQMDRLILLVGRELTVVFANENRKKPAEMRARERVRYWPIILSFVCSILALILASYAPSMHILVYAE